MRVYPVVFLLLAVSLFVPLATAAPTVLPESASLYETTSSDYIYIQSGGSATSVRQFEIHGPLVNQQTATSLGIIWVHDSGGASAPGDDCGSAPDILSNAGGRFVKVGMNGAIIAASDTADVTITGTSLDGQPGDGTWRINMQGVDLNICLVINGKAVRTQMPGGQAASGCPVFWNYRSTTSGYSYACNDPSPSAEQDPNNFVFFQPVDTPPPPGVPDGDPRPFTGESSVTCPDSATLNGVWSRGITQTLNTFATFYHVPSQILQDSDLRDNLGVLSTGYVDKGSGTSGTHSATIVYNNAVGNSYQLVVKNGTGGAEQLGSVLFVAPLLCTTPPPTIALIATHTEVVEASVSQAQCNGDQTSFAIVVDLVPGGTQSISDMDAFIVDTDTGIPVMSVDDSQMFKSPNFQAWWFNRTLPPGPWAVLVIVDITGVGAVDGFDNKAFSVPGGTCGNTLVDILSINTHTTNTVNDDGVRTRSHINTTSVFQGDMTRDLINDTTVLVLSVIDDLADFVGLHFPQTNSYINATRDALSDEHDTMGLYPHCERRTTTTSDCEGVQTQISSELVSVHSHIDSHFNETLLRIAEVNSDMNDTFQAVLHNHDEIHNIINGNLTCANCSFEGANETEIQSLLIQVMNPIADQLAIIAWVILVAVTYWAGQREKGRGISYILSAAVVFLGLAVLPEGPLYTIVSIGTGAILVGAAIHSGKKEEIQ